MKKFVFVLLILPMFVACNQKEIKQLKEQNAQLTQMAQESDVIINDFVESMNVIEENLETIKEKEQIIAVNAQEAPNKNQREIIVSDLILINDLLAKNKEDLESLNKKLKNSGFQNSKLSKLCDRLRVQIEEKEAAISALNNMVYQLTAQIETMNDNVAQLDGVVEELNAVNESKAQVIQEQTMNLNTAYFVVGSSKELKEKQVIYSKGGFLGIGKTNKLSKDINADQFKKIDITQTTTIALKGKKVNLVTSHPQDSYRIEGTDKNVEGITILKPEEFWKASKYLVLAVK